jgi:hypothetical protein
MKTRSFGDLIRFEDRPRNTEVSFESDAVVHQLKYHRPGTEMKIIRKRYRVLILAALSAALAVPLGIALSLEPAPTVVAPVPAAGISQIGIVAAASTKPHLALVQAPKQPGLPALTDGAKLLFVGTVLFGLAGVMRRS